MMPKIGMVPPICPFDYSL